MVHGPVIYTLLHSRPWRELRCVLRHGENAERQKKVYPVRAAGRPQHSRTVLLLARATSPSPLV